MKIIKSIYLHPIFYWILSGIAALSVFGYFFPILYSLAQIALLLFVIAISIDFLLLYRIKNGIEAVRICPEKLSNGDENEICIELSHYYGFGISVELIDEIPVQFQIRDFLHLLLLKRNEKREIRYQIRPTERGAYQFGRINVFASSNLKIIKRRYRIEAAQSIPCYPSFIQMRQYELMASTNRLSDYGIKKIRRVGHQMEFDHIREYVKGDDYRSINWKASARKSQIMVNQYEDEKAQPVYSIIDCGRAMKMPFEQLSLLDYAINSSLVLSNAAILKQDKAGLICFGKKIQALVPPSDKRTQIKKIMEVLYNQYTEFPEPNYELLYTTIKHKISNRSLLMLYTNFESLDSMRRQLPLLQQISKYHVLLVILFNNTEIADFIDRPTKSIEDIYNKTIAEKHLYDKRLIVKELEKYGIHAILSDPEKLTINALNKYLEIKSRALI